MKVLALVVALLSVIAPPALCRSGEIVKWGQVGGWSIEVDRSVGGCFALQRYADGTGIRLGFEPNKNSVYLMLGNPAWKSLEPGKLYQIRFVFDGPRSHVRELRADVFGGSVYLDQPSIGVEFAKDFMQRNELSIYYQGTEIARLPLTNTNDVMAEVLECQKEVSSTGNQGSSGDPFARGGTRDPASR